MAVRGIGRLRAGSGRILLTQPSGFSWSGGPTIYRSGPSYLTGFDIDARRPATSVTYYVDPVNGSDSNDGLTDLTPRAKVSTTVPLANTGAVPAKFVCKPGVYYGDQGWNGAVPTVNFLLEPWADDPSDPANRVWFARPASLTSDQWFLEAGSQYRWGGFFATVFAVFDITSIVDGLPRKYEAAADKATCAATPGSYWRDPATSRLYLRAFDSRSLTGTGDKGILVSTTGGGSTLRFAATTDLQMWVQNVYCFDGSNVIDVTAGATGIDVRVYLKDCAGFGSVLGNSMYFTTLQADSTIEVYLKRCGAGYSYADGFNYRAEASGASVRYFEDECFTARNGYSGSGANNATTAHGTAVGVSMNCTYAGSEDRVVNDINDTKRWMVGCEVAASAGSGATAISVQAGSASGTHTTEIWMDDCSVEESTTAAVHAEPTCAVRYRNMSLSGLTVTGTGTVETY